MFTAQGAGFWRARRVPNRVVRKKREGGDGSTTKPTRSFDLLANQVLTNGKSKGHLKGQFVDDNQEVYDVKLSFTEKNPLGSVKITKDGMSQSTKSFLQTIFKYHDFDASDFIGMSKTTEGRRKQVEIVKNLLPVEVQDQMTKIDSDIEQAKEERKDGD